MFVAFCPLHGCDVLLGIGRIRELVNLTPGVMAIELECYDGQRLIVLTGKQLDLLPRREPGGSGARQSGDHRGGPAVR